MDGTKHSFARFDEQKRDCGYTAVLEWDTDSLISTSAAKRASWICYDFTSKLDRWETPRRTILTTLVAEDDQYVLEGIRDMVMYTNLGNNDLMDGELHMRGFANLVKNRRHRETRPS